jgi:hypothetical protein
MYDKVRPTCVTINPRLQANDKLDLSLAWTWFQRRAVGDESAGTERAKKPVKGGYVKGLGVNLGG